MNARPRQHGLSPRVRHRACNAGAWPQQRESTRASSVCRATSTTSRGGSVPPANLSRRPSPVPSVASTSRETTVYMLAQLFHTHVFSLPRQPWDSSSQAFPSMSWPLRVGSLDWVACGISESLMSYVGRGRVVGDPERAFFVTNTQWSGQRGSHWISVALSMHYD